MKNKKKILFVFTITLGIILSFQIFPNKKKKMCIFCEIEKTDTEILYKDDEIIAFRDIKPAAKFHFLIIPKIHIKNTKALTTNHKTLCK